MASDTSTLPNMNPTIGPEEVGVVAGAWMFGMFTVQVSELDAGDMQLLI
jgi:hypothetical protein